MTKSNYNRYIDLCRKFALDEDFHELLQLHMIRYNIYITDMKLNGTPVDISALDKLIYELSEI
jgi:hypothetical protein